MVNFLRSCLSFIVISIFTLALTTAIFTFDLKDTFLNSKTLKKVLSDGKVYEHFAADFLPTFLSGQLSKDKDNPSVPAPLLKSLAEKVIPPPTLQADTEKVIDELIPYLDNKKSTLNVTIDLTSYKKRFTDNLKPTLTNYLAALPLCAIGNETVDLEKIPSCLPKDLSAEQIADQLPLADIENSLANLPSSFVVSETGFTFEPKDTNEATNLQNKGNNFNLKNIQRAVSLVNLAIIVGLVAALISLVVLLIVWFGQFRNGLKKIAYALFSTAFLPAITGGALILAINQDLLNGLHIKLSNEIVKPFFDHLGTLLLLQAGGLVIIGIALLVSLRIFPKEKEFPAAKSS
ncbi:MAG: hypothetical protein A3F35_01920 [Candidatus Woykebacteria bacterium RIFCSPHIGHO2_12_FULL_45_10]|uniref:Uncharacterized protein n=1 Tax=Candidatus Woykebacteria bacterium RIFCSPHIGHO2_12_FULL_45_10 TaxID=1802603 RepID=A0A1G1WP60_9BACT|nr:MAG: hypothetical protein A3F35_01920 [Candidatus Woykebacteria bacterium RIFCSPHIGHO2_12_FULL_45_10]